MQLYGLIGYPLVHSFSKKYFNEKFKNEGLINCYYENFELENIDEVRELSKQKPELKGLNVTIPHKNKIVEHLDDCSDVVQQLHACNTVKIIYDKWIGYNTDVIGFERSFASQLQSHHKKALILGTGGSSKAVEFVLQKLGIDYLFVSSSKKSDRIIPYYQSGDVIGDHNIVINTTPVGQFPHIDECPKIDYDRVSEEHYFFDLVYNPQKTLFLKKAEERGAVIKNGYDMLIIQAEESWKIWNS